MTGRNVAPILPMDQTPLYDPPGYGGVPPNQPTTSPPTTLQGYPSGPQMQPFVLSPSARLSTSGPNPSGMSNQDSKSNYPSTYQYPPYPSGGGTLSLPTSQYPPNPSGGGTFPTSQYPSGGGTFPTSQYPTNPTQYHVVTNQYPNGTPQPSQYPNQYPPNPYPIGQAPNPLGQPGSYAGQNTYPNGAAQLVVPQVFPPHPVSMQCPRCQHAITSQVRKETGTGTWLIYAGMCCLGCWPCAPCVFFNHNTLDTYHYCPDCQALIGKKAVMG